MVSLPLFLAGCVVGYWLYYVFDKMPRRQRNGEGDLQWIENNYASVHCNYTVPDWTVGVPDAEGLNEVEYHGRTIRGAVGVARRSQR